MGNLSKKHRERIQQHVAGYPERQRLRDRDRLMRKVSRSIVKSGNWDREIREGENREIPDPLSSVLGRNAILHLKR